MMRVLPLAYALATTATIVTTALSAHAAETASTAPTASAAPTLVELEAQPQKNPSDPDYWAVASRQTRQALQLIESNTLSTADELFRAAKFVTASDNRYRTARVQYELFLSAAALGHAEAEKQLAAQWDQLLAALGRPLRTDFRELKQKQPEFFETDFAPACVQNVLRDPAKARELAKSTQRNAEIKTIVDADQADRRRDWSKLTAEEMNAVRDRDKARNQRIREIIQAGDLHTAADFANAALVMQHSAKFSGYQTAHELAVCALLLGDRGLGRWLVAATYDRMLGSIGHDQRFGTQYSGMGGASSLVQVDTAGICDRQRQALGCPTLAEARNRNLDRKSDEEASRRLIAEFSGPDRTVRDPKFGLIARYPEGWKLRHVLRWGDQQNTLFFEIAGQTEASPNLYYRVYREPRPMTREALDAFVREEAKKKETSRREQMPDYTNRAGSFKTFAFGDYSAFSWAADYTSSNGDKWAEYFVRIQTDVADASFFLQAPANAIDAIRPAVDQLMAGLKMPAQPQAK